MSLKFSKRVLLTGAGFSRNWGGWTAAEFWEQIIGNQEVQKNEELRIFLLKNLSFEDALAKAREGGIEKESLNTLVSAIQKEFDAMNERFRQLDHVSFGINWSGVEEMLCRFWGQQGSGNNIGYFFTINQDVFLEYNFVDYLPIKSSVIIPGIQGSPNIKLFDGTTRMHGPLPRMLVDFDPQQLPSLCGSFNYIKLSVTGK